MFYYAFFHHSLSLLKSLPRYGAYISCFCLGQGLTVDHHSLFVGHMMEQCTLFVAEVVSSLGSSKVTRSSE